MILGLDVSTTITGATILDDAGNIQFCEAWRMGNKRHFPDLLTKAKFIKNNFSDRDKEYKQLEAMVEKEKIVITPLAYIRGRSLANIIFIVDESQNLTPHEVKTIITRAGEGAKFIFTGDVRQIDTPYLDEQSNGLSYLVDKVKGHPMYAHITLEKGERSALANLANDLL